MTPSAHRVRDRRTSAAEGTRARPLHRDERDDATVSLEDWSCRHFSLSNPAGRTASDLPRLLRREASSIADRGIMPMDILDVTISQEMTADGPWRSATVYWQPDDRETRDSLR
jgi:hypothetical protein